MKLSHKTRRRLSLILLLVWLPLFVVVAVNVVEMFERPPILLELGIYVGLGIVWALPFRFVFLGVGRDAPEDEG
ncbi:MAG: DUF2842 domain-containing protein [Pseudomonadota bacterium]